MANKTKQSKKQLTNQQLPKSDGKKRKKRKRRTKRKKRKNRTEKKEKYK